MKPRKSKGFSLHGTPKILGKGRKNAPKKQGKSENKKSKGNRKTKKNKTKKARKTGGSGLFWVDFIRVDFPLLKWRLEWQVLSQSPFVAESPPSFPGPNDFGRGDPVAKLFVSHLCKACRSAAVQFSPETVRGSCHGKCREISGEILLAPFLRKRSSKAPRIFHDEFHATFHETLCSCKCPISWHFSLCRGLSLTFQKKRSRASRSQA